MMRLASFSIWCLASSAVICQAMKLATARPTTKALISTRLNFNRRPTLVSKNAKRKSACVVDELGRLLGGEKARLIGFELELEAADGGPGLGAEHAVDAARVVADRGQRQLGLALLLVGHALLVGHGDAWRRRRGRWRRWWRQLGGDGR